MRPCPPPLLILWRIYKIHPFKWSQLKVIGLFALILLGILWIDPDFGNKWITMTVNSVIVVLAFPVVLYFTKIEPEIVEYVDKVLLILRGKLGFKKK